MQPAPNTALDAEPPQRNDLAPRRRRRKRSHRPALPVRALPPRRRDPLAPLVDVDGVRLVRVEVRGAPDAEADVARKVPGPLLALDDDGEVAREEVLRVHDEGELVLRRREARGVDGPVEVVVDAGESDERLVVQAGEDLALELEG